MMKKYRNLRPGHWLGLAAVLLTAGQASAQASFSYNAGSAINMAGTYTDLALTGTAIAVANNDDANSAAQSIGFNFVYNGTTFTQFVLNTNGVMRLGAAAPSSPIACSPYSQEPEAGPINSINAADTNLLMPFNFDLEPGSGTPEFRVATTGTAPNRVCTIQWKNMADKAAPTDDADSTPLVNQIANFSFQVKLYETTNQIDFVYGPASAGGTSTLKYAEVGIKGSGYEIGRDVLATKPSMQAWSVATFLSGPQLDPSQANAFNFRSVALPDAGRTIRFTTCTATPVTTYPYTNNFDTPAAAGSYSCGATGLDANQDLLTWFKLPDGTTTYSSSAPNSLAIESSGSTAADDWYFTPGLQMRAGYTYQLQFKYRGFGTSSSGTTYTDAIQVKAGTAATPAGQTLSLFSASGITSTAYVTTSTSAVTAIRPTTTDTYYIGFHSVSPTTGGVLFIDDISVTEAVSLSVKMGTNTLFSAEAAPVPFSNSLILSLDTRTAGPLRLTLRDALGRTVRQTTATVAAGSSSLAVPEVASLPAGVYLLDIEQAGQKQVLRVTHE